MEDKKITTFEKQPNVIIEEKSPSKIVIRNTVTGNHTSLTDKTDITIMSFSEKNDDIFYVKIIAGKLNIKESRVITLFKKLAKRGFLVNTTEKYELPD